MPATMTIQMFAPPLSPGVSLTTTPGREKNSSHSTSLPTMRQSHPILQCLTRSNKIVTSFLTSQLMQGRPTILTTNLFVQAVKGMLVIAAGVGLSEMLLEETVIRQTGDASVHTTTEMNAQATTSTAKTGVQPHKINACRWSWPSSDPARWNSTDAACRCDMSR